jgi:2-polyprenyl-3-methyl-5-hydroxy-6-metoxy-1,4-benzoquinol methylase
VAHEQPGLAADNRLVERYVIRGGERGYGRLQLLARERWPGTAALLGRAGLAPGMTTVDLGCGGGNVTIEIARLIAPALATGIDMDEVKLALAREAATARGIANVQFRAMNLHDWHEPAAYDVVYARFVLQHLSQPVQILRQMWEAVRPDGVVIVEDADFDGWASYPPSPGLDFFTRTYAEVIRRSGGDHSMARKLYAYFMEAGIGRPEVQVNQPVYIDGEGKALPWTTLEATADLIVVESIASRDEVEAALRELKRLAEDQETLILGPRIFQLWRRRAK